MKSNKSTEIDLNKILEITRDRFILIENYMNVEDSFLYGYLNGETCIIRKINNFWDFAQKNKVETYTDEEIIDKIKKETMISNLNELYSEGDGNYQSIFKFSSLTINPYAFSISDRVKKMKNLLMKTGKFKKIGNADLFLYGLQRRTVTIIEDEKKFFLDYICLLNGHYLLFDIEKDQLIIEQDEKVIQKKALQIIKGKEKM